MEKIHATTILAALHNGQVSIAGDGQEQGRSINTIDSKLASTEYLDFTENK